MTAAEPIEIPTLSRRGTVLVVDDEVGVRASIRAILEERCEILEAETGADALEILRNREVDLVMLDQRMPGELGIDVLPRVKAADPSTVVVVATAVLCAALPFFASPLQPDSMHNNRMTNIGLT